MSNVRDVLGDAYEYALSYGTPADAFTAVDIILNALNDAGFKIVPHQQGVSSFEAAADQNTDD